MKTYFSSLIILLLLIGNSSFSQTYTSGNTYYDTTTYVEYKAGNLPIIISAPHGGLLTPSSIPDRTCDGCITTKDSWTQSIAKKLHNKLFELTGCYPHTIINKLHRKKFDANRDIGDAADGNPVAEEAWYAYHKFIDTAKAQIISKYKRGLFLDIHGHGHTIQRIELGYLLGKSILQLPDSLLNTDLYVKESSFRMLATDNTQNYSHTELLRGQSSFGELLGRKGFPSVPSFSDPYPKDTDPYLSGGYNTRRYGSRTDGSRMDAIQIELNQDVRFDTSKRTQLIDALALSIIDFYTTHYKKIKTKNACTISLKNLKNSKLSDRSIVLMPNPTTTYFSLKNNLERLDIIVYNNLEKEVLSQSIAMEKKIDISRLKKGLYFVKVFKDDSLLNIYKLFKK